MNIIIVAVIVGWIAGMFTAAGIVKGDRTVQRRARTDDLDGPR